VQDLIVTLRTLQTPFIPHVLISRRSTGGLSALINHEGLIEVQRRDQTGISDLVGPTRRCHRGIREFAPSSSYGLITTVVAEGFLATKAERMHDREIIEGEETHIIRCGEICMFMPHP
jgi:hypothetical protein